MTDPATHKAKIWGWCLLAVFLPLGMALEALHAVKHPAFLDSEVRREMWTLAHAHGNLLGILCLVFAAIGRSSIGRETGRRSVSLWLRVGAVLMPLGFFLGGVLNREGDPSWGILLVPVAAACLLYALGRAAVETIREPS